MKNWFCRPVAKYVVTMVISLLLYAVALVVSLLWLKAGRRKPWKYSIAVLPVLPALGIPLAVVRFCQAMDELQLRMQLEAWRLASRRRRSRRSRTASCKTPACRT